ncbi:energy transducer TonB [Paludibaculum fermentans]|uniref:energy transducer TonB n=1 Tax=Paludibaculum fermentans TaxID=1473598 RepID=UPI003EBE53B6
MAVWSPVRAGSNLTAPQLIKAGAALKQGDAAALEKGLEKKPDDVDARLELIGYYSSRPAGVELQTIRERRAAHVMWLIEKDPKNDTFGYGPPAWHISRKGDSLSDEAAFNNAEAAWKKQIQAHPKDHKVKQYAAIFLQLGDPETAAGLFREIGDTRAAGSVAANYLLGIIARDPITDDPSAVDEAQRDSDYGRRILGELQASRDAAFQGGAGFGLATDGAMLYADGKINWDYSKLAGELLERARGLEPNKLDWAVVPTKLPARGELTPRVMRVEWGKLKGAVKKYTPPKYPALAKQNRVQGTVGVDVAIGTNGKVLKAIVLGGPKDLTFGVAETIAEWEFAPIVVAGRPAILLTAIPIDFNVTSQPVR